MGKISTIEMLDIMAQASNRLTLSLRNAYAAGNLKEYLASISMGDLYPEEKPLEWDGSYDDGMVIIFGEPAMKPKDLLGVLKSVGLSRDRVELHLDYKSIASYNFETQLRYKSKYRLIIVGPIPHSAAGKDDFSSPIPKMETVPGYTRVIRLTSNGELKITKTNLKTALQDQINSGYLKAG